MRINFAGEAIDVLGGNIAVGKLFGLDYRVVLNWRTRGFPPDTYAVLAPALTAKGYEFSPLLFAQKLHAAQLHELTKPKHRKRRKRSAPVTEDARNG
jgi:hypothetical protein